MNEADVAEGSASSLKRYLVAGDQIVFEEVEDVEDRLNEVVKAEAEGCPGGMVKPLLDTEKELGLFCARLASELLEGPADDLPCILLFLAAACVEAWGETRNAIAVFSCSLTMSMKDELEKVFGPIPELT